MLYTEFNIDDALDVRFEEGMQRGQQVGMEIGQKIGQKIGQEIGQEAMLKLVNAMIADGHSKDLPKLQQDLDFRRSMFEKYHVNEV